MTWPSEGLVLNGGPEKCQSADCRKILTPETATYMHKDRETGKLIFFCGDCSRMIQMEHSLRFPLVAL